jgi:hypothetical protein
MNPLLLILGTGVVGFGIFQLTKSLKLSKNGIKMEATIVNVRKKKSTSTDEDGYTSTTDMYYPVFSYTYEGEEYTKESNVGTSNKRKHKVGNMLNIIFMSDTPQKATVRGGSMWFMPFILIFVGVIMLISYFVV